MLSVVNVSPEDAPDTGINQYEVRVNNKVNAGFEHDRQYGDAAQCLRDAADAIEKAQQEKYDRLLNALLPTFERMNNK